MYTFPNWKCDRKSCNDYCVEEKGKGASGQRAVLLLLLLLLTPMQVWVWEDAQKKSPVLAMIRSGAIAIFSVLNLFILFFFTIRIGQVVRRDQKMISVGRGYLKVEWLGEWSQLKINYVVTLFIILTPTLIINFRNKNYVN